MAMLTISALLVGVVLANLLDSLFGSRSNAWIVTLVFLVVMLIVAGFAAKRRWDGVFIDKDNRISLSRFQLVVWTILLVSTLFTAGLTNATPPGAVVDPLNIRIPPEIWALLGLGAFTAVAAPAIKEGKRGGANLALVTDQVQAHQSAAGLTLQRDQKLAAPPFFDGRVLAKASSTDARWIDLIMGDYEGGGYVDVSKLQKLAFTVLVATVYGVGLWQVMSGTNPVIRDFPTVDPGLLALLGISHAAYLADKQIAGT
jgi:hypothetical protein